MAYMTENTNLQRALLRRIAEIGQGKVEIREEAKVQEMRMDEGKRSVVLKLGEEGWVRGGVVVSVLLRGGRMSEETRDLTKCGYHCDRSERTGQIRQSGHSQRSNHSATRTLLTGSSLPSITVDLMPTIRLSSASCLPAPWPFCQ